MIVSHKYKFIFLRTEKTASTSLTKALVDQIGDRDEVITSFKGNWVKYMPIHPGGLKRAFPRQFGLHFHAHAKDVRTAIGHKIFDSYYKFAVERNPWDRQVSLYFHRALRENYKNPDFDRDMSSPIHRALYYTKLHNWDIYSIDNNIVADRVLRYENLAKEIPDLFRTLGIDHNTQLSHANPGFGGKRPHYSTYYTDKTRELVAKWYRREIDALGFSFEDQSATNHNKAAGTNARSDPQIPEKLTTP